MIRPLDRQKRLLSHRLTACRGNGNSRPHADLSQTVLVVYTLTIDPQYTRRRA